VNAHHDASRQPVVVAVGTPARKRKLGHTDLDEIPDSDGADEDFGWGEDDDDALPALPPQWQGSEDLIIGTQRDSDGSEHEQEEDDDDGGDDDDGSSSDDDDGSSSDDGDDDNGNGNNSNGNNRNGNNSNESGNDNRSNNRNNSKADGDARAGSNDVNQSP
jgi:hypothetical protein